MSNQPRFEVFPEMGWETDHETTAPDRSEYLPGGEITVCDAWCSACDWTEKGDPADTRDAAAAHEREHPKPTGEFCWHFRDANARITFTGGESFTRREDAHRAIEGVRRDVGVCGVCRQGGVNRPPIVDLDENGNVITSRESPPVAKALDGEGAR